MVNDIECTTEKIYRKGRRFKKRKRVFSFLFVLFIAAIVFAYNRYFVFNQVYEICRAESLTISAESLNEASLLSLSSVEYSDLIRVEKDASGKITLLSANSAKINKINKDLAVKCEVIMSDKIASGIPVPLFSFSGLRILSGFGPTVRFKSVSVPRIKSEFVSEFLSAGINQTLHSLYVKIDCEIDLIFPLEKKTVECSSTVLVSEAVLVGEVPEFYLKGARSA